MKHSYHHGDLRAAVVAAAIARLSTDTDFSLREVARDIGVSATAIYRHFPDKDALLQALALETANRMGAAQMAASAAAGGGVAGFNACGRAYVHFALENPVLFRLMSSRAHIMDSQSADASVAMRFLHESIEGLQPDEHRPDARLAKAVHAWSLVHGLAVLMLDGQVPQDLALIDAVIDAKGFVDA